MSKYNEIGGLRLKLKGRNSKNKVISNISKFLDSLCEDNDLESFSGVNLYLQMYDNNGDRLALIGSDNYISQGVDVTNIKDDFSFGESGYRLMTVKRIEDIHEQRLNEQKKIAKQHKARLAELQRKEQEEKQELAAFRTFVCEKYNVKHINDVMSSIGRIKDKKAILKYISDANIPECGYVFRATKKDKLTGKAGEVDIYDNTFTLISRTD